MLGTLKERLNRRKTKKTFRSSQDTLPYLNAYTDGVFQVKRRNVFPKSILFTISIIKLHPLSKNSTILSNIAMF